MQGWIKIHRQIEEWEWYTDANTFRLFFHLLIKANHRDKKWRGMMLKSGSVLTGRDKLSMETNMSVQNVRTALKKLESTNEITIKTSKQGTIIQIVKYKEYQSQPTEQPTANHQTNQQPTNNQPTANQQLTTNKKEKNDDNDNNDKKKEVEIPWGDNFKKYWGLWKQYKKEQHNFTYASAITEQAALTRLTKDAGGIESVAVDMIEKAISRGWRGIIKENNGKTTGNEAAKNLLAKWAKQHKERVGG
jgi:predicted transcriptional regulator